MLAQWNT
jgi:hypothetical protein